MVVGTAIEDDAVAVAKVRVGPIAEMVPSAWAAVSDFVAPANARHRIGRMETERVG